MTAVDRLDRLVGAALDKQFGDVRSDRPGAWRFDLGNGVPMPARARLRDGWLEIGAPLRGEPHAGEAWSRLERNGVLAGPARLVADQADLALRADVPLHDPSAVPDRLRVACESMRGWHGTVAETDPAPDAAEPLSGDEGDRWIAAAAEAGWNVARRPDGHLAARLPVAGHFDQARVAASNGGALLAVRLAKGNALDPSAREAIAAFLLRGTAALRLVRAAVRSGSGGTAAAWQVLLEVPLPRRVDGGELDAALSALTVACRHCARESRALTDVRLARAYLDHTTTEAHHAIR